MANTSPVLLVLGSGANVEQPVARAFAAKGYRVALTSRKANSDNSAEKQVQIAGDLSKPESVPEIFSKTKELLGIPSVVYNGKPLPQLRVSQALNDPNSTAGAATPNNAKDPLSLPLAEFTGDLNINNTKNINTTSAFVAAQQAAVGFAQLSDTASKTFIYTGNILN